MSFRALNKLRRLALFPAFFLGAYWCSAQPAPVNPALPAGGWQQEVNYRIEVTLNDSLHTLRGTVHIIYKNNSPSALQLVYMHLWPNAYRNGRTGLAKQQLEEGKPDLYFASEGMRGYIDSLSFTVNGNGVKWKYDPVHIDICELTLDRALEPGDSILISTPFYVKIPDARFSRLGHTLQAYYITQWYPKPAVYDSEGWHPMPYLDQGEFYSEFGSFDVSITLPANYVLAATGDRINAPDELDFLNKKIGETKNELAEYVFNKDRGRDTIIFPRSERTYKTVRFVQRNVHDFAWFADKRFRVIKGNVRLESGHTVDTWVFFTPSNTRLWKDALEYVNRSVLFYSKHVGEYPYRHASAVDGTIMAGGGMEYPNITVIGNVPNAMDLDLTITHEVGHNWFYGMLASNERKNPFLDEGLNSFYELQYMRENYPRAKITSFLGLDSAFRLFGLRRVPFWRYHGISYDFAQRRRDDQPMNLSSEVYTSNNYGSVIYSKTAAVMDYLQQVNGYEKLEKVMKKYFADFRFRHPRPQDFENALVSGGIVDSISFKNLFTTSGEIDYRITRVKRKSDTTCKIKFRNTGDIASPFELNGIKGDKIVTTTVVPGFKTRKEIEVAGDADGFWIDAENRMPEIFRGDNYMTATGFFRRKRALKIQLITGIDEPRKRQLFVLPALCGNYYNGLMGGIVFHNYGLLMKKFEWAVVPLYAFRSKSPAGVADFEYKFFPGQIFTRVALGTSLRSFAFYDGALKGEGGRFAHYYKAAPYLELVMKKNPRSRVTHTLKFTSHNMKADSTATKSWNPFRELSYWQVNEVKYMFYNSNVLHHSDGSVRLQQSRDVLKLDFSFNYEPLLNEKYTLPIRFFGGVFLGGSTQDKRLFAFRASGYNGVHDYTFSHYFLGRNEQSGLGFSQYADVDGNLKIWTPYGQSTTWLAAMNIKSPAFFRLPVRLFGDVVFCDKMFLGNDNFLWDAGVNLTIVREIIDVYYSFLQSGDINQALDANNVGYANRVRFTFNINKLVPKRLVREIGF